MDGREFDVVTGAFGYTGKYLARRLAARGRRVRTLTGTRSAPRFSTLALRWRRYSLTARRN
jgi:nucleoside-diphosphate-sugar epimerase